MDDIQNTGFEEAQRSEPGGIFPEVNDVAATLVGETRVSDARAGQRLYRSAGSRKTGDASENQYVSTHCAMSGLD